MQKFDEDGLELALNSLDGDFISEYYTPINITIRDIEEGDCVKIAQLFGGNGEVKRLEDDSFQIAMSRAALLGPIMRYLMRIIYDGEQNIYHEILKNLC